MVQGCGYWVYGTGLGVQGIGYMVQGCWYWVYGTGLGVQGFGSKVNIFGIYRCDGKV